MTEEHRPEGEDGARQREAPTEMGTGVEERGDLDGATSTHAGAGGVMDNTGGTGTAPISDS
jgi:hypothetical protein